jgi:glycosyltransferase involved in cell wall biosynthesis
MTKDDPVGRAKVSGRSSREHVPVLVAAITSGRKVPSSRYRVRQYIDPIRSFGIQVREYPALFSRYASLPRLPGEGTLMMRPVYAAWQATKVAASLPGLVGSRKHQITWLERTLVPGRYSLEGLLRRPLVFDVDDAIWLGHRKAAEAAARMASKADLLIVANQFLADWFQNHGARAVHVVPTVIDTRRFQPSPGNGSDATFTIGWTGTRVSLPYLNSIERPLSRVFAEIPQAKLLVVCDTPPVLPSLPPDRVEFVRWSPETEVTGVQRMDVGVMPLVDDELSRGKASLKMLQYMACGLPVVVSPVGTNAEILSMSAIGFGPGNDDDWAEALIELHRSAELRTTMGIAGRTLAEERFSVQHWTPRLAALFKELA